MAGAKREGARGTSAEPITVAITASTGGGSLTGRFAGSVGAAGDSGSSGGTRMSAGDSGGITGSIFGVDGAPPAHTPSRFHVQFQPAIPALIGCAVPGPVVSPQVHVQFQVQLDGRLEAAGADSLVVDGAGAEEIEGDGSGAGCAAGACC